MTAKNWNIDAAHTGIGFSVRHMVVSKVRGRFGRYSGSVKLDDEDLTRSEVSVEIEAASLDTGVADRDTHLRSADFFDVERFPKLTFRSSRIEPRGGNRFKVTGDLTIRDVTREVELDVEYGGQAKDPWGNQRAGFLASTSIDRKDFGLRWNQMLETGGVLVGDRVDVEIELQLIKAVAEQAA